MHGTVMMFLFAVPVVEAIGVLLLPQMQAARDLPFPRLSAFAFWAYLIGGLFFFGSLFFDLAPDGGWFMYPPLTSIPLLAGRQRRFLAARHRLHRDFGDRRGDRDHRRHPAHPRTRHDACDKMPVFAWSMLVFAGMIVFAFPAVILATLLLELERAFQWPFFIPDKGGDPLLWQHLFWFFGHPEVYIIFLPAAGMVSMIVPTMTGVPLVGYRLIVVALVATGFFSFGLWVHHMFATGIPELSLAFFSAASMAVAIPSGIQVFSWIATIAAGRLRLTVPSLFVLGFLAIFVIGGLTGVMVAMVPFDWQAHDTYFIVAHLHYVLFGGMVFPVFAAIYYWAPTFSARPLSERLGRWSFGLLFVGFNVTFFPMHFAGLMGMPRRVYTYPENMGWDWLNLLSTVGAFIGRRGRSRLPRRPRRQLPLRHFRQRRKRLEGRHARMAAERCLRHAQHSRGIEPRTAVGRRRTRRRRGGRPLLPARRADRRARDAGHESDRSSAAVCPAGARSELAFVLRGACSPPHSSCC